MLSLYEIFIKVIYFFKIFFNKLKLKYICVYIYIYEIIYLILKLNIGGLFFFKEKSYWKSFLNMWELNNIFGNIWIKY